MHDDTQLAVVLQALPRVAVHGPWSRAVAYRLTFAGPPGSAPGSPAQPLWPGGAPLNGGRFTPKGAFDCLYVADDPVTALEEANAVFRIPGGAVVPHLYEPFVVLSVDGIVADVLELTDSLVQGALGTNDSELRGPWLRAQARFGAGMGPMPPTQRLGLASWNSGLVTGLRYPSARADGGVNLVVFTDRLNLNAANGMKVHDPSGNMRQQLP